MERVEKVMKNSIIQKSLVWGGFCGGLIAAHKLKMYPGFISHAIRSGLIAFGVACLISVHYSKHQLDTQLRKSQLLGK